MDRRGFFAWAAAVIAWLWGAKPSETLGGELYVKPCTEYKWESDSGASGGFVVPAEFVPQIENMIATGKPITLEFSYGDRQLTIEDVCRLRGVKPLTEEEQAAERRYFVRWNEWLRSRHHANRT